MKESLAHCIAMKSMNELAFAATTTAALRSHAIAVVLMGYITETQMPAA